MQRPPVWRTDPESVWIHCKPIDWDAQPYQALGELVVHFSLGGKMYTTFAPRELIDVQRNLMQAAIIADCDDDLLVQIPAETLTSGPRFLVSEVEESMVRTSGERNGP